MLDLRTPEIAFLIETTAEASRLVQRIQVSLAGQSLSKEDRSPVTVADFAAQALVSCRLQQRFNSTKLVAEESAAALRQPAGQAILAQVLHFVRTVIPDATPEQVFAWIDAGQSEAQGRYWLLDPIDGTKGFLRGGQYAVALALMENGNVLLGALGCPGLEAACDLKTDGAGSLAAAQAGQGAWQTALSGSDPTSKNWGRLQVSDCTNPGAARLLRSYESSHTNSGSIEKLVQHLGITAPPVRMDSQAKYALLAAGCGEAMLRLPPDDNLGYQEKIWDQAAGALILEEAGGRISDLDGKPLDFTHGRTLARNRGVLASNGHLHAALLEGLRTLSL